MIKKITIVLFSAVVLMTGCTNKEKEVVIDKPVIKDPVVENYSLSLIAAGDALIHRGIYYDANTYQTGADGHLIYDFTKMFTYVKEIISGYDLAFYNQETVIGGKSIGLLPNKSGTFIFNSPDEIGLDLVKTGFNLVNLASNHTMDVGGAAALYGANFWKKQEGVYAVGSYTSQEERDAVVIKEKNNITYTLLAYTTLTNGLNAPAGQQYLVNLYSPEQAKIDVEKVRDKVDVIMVSMHWGTEYVYTPTAEQKEIANYLASLGVDVIIGTHPHVVEPIEFIDDTLVIYSLGNLISAQADENTRVGLFAALTINKTVTDGVSKIEITNVKADLVWDYYVNYSKFKVIPFNKLDESILPNHEAIYNKYIAYVNPTGDKRIQLGFFE